MSSVGVEFPNELLRCHELIQTYDAMGPAGAFGAAAIRLVVLKAKEAWASQDPVEIVRAFAEMRGCE